MTGMVKIHPPKPRAVSAGVSTFACEGGFPVCDFTDLLEHIGAAAYLISPQMAAGEPGGYCVKLADGRVFRLAAGKELVYYRH